MQKVGRRWVGVIAAVLAVLAVGVSVAGAARSGDFRDEFTSFEVRRWVKVDRPFGHGRIDSANVSVANGLLGSACRRPPRRCRGALTSLYRYGTFRTRMKIANAPSSLTAFFLYKKPDFAQEVDIEIFNDSTGRVMFSTYSGSAQTNSEIVDTELRPECGLPRVHDRVRPGLGPFPARRNGAQALLERSSALVDVPLR